jgi:hypothetical protein
MAIDEPIDKKLFEIEDAHSTPFIEPIAEGASLVLSFWPNAPKGLAQVVQWLKNPHLTSLR